ncbi:helix-turn-helix domain-containing protein [Priestia flexa]|jgi:transcriptional regulator with XRE-family HTH domain|uniref:Helix-turn-helix domain-containing protein n=1 Tax=Priestia flexa TaxID=86664 RepID=A0ABU4J4C0_9BACI|nr:helix-turn-helix domain-containing protein [Priestia flexa]MDW8515848.1 helix-turn-helix domain-containing protein [Priestia flexa]
MQVGKYLKELRKPSSQEQLALDLNLSREAVSSYETGRAKIPVDIAGKLMEKFDDPWFAMKIARQYTNGAWVPKLDGDFIELNRSNVVLKTIEELQEAIVAVKGAPFVKHPKSLAAYELQDIQNSLAETIDVIVAASHLVAVSCEEYGFSWNELWDQHTMKLVSSGYMKNA